MKLIFFLLFMVACFGWLFDKPKNKKTKSFGKGMFKDTPNTNHYQNF